MEYRVIKYSTSYLPSLTFLLDRTFTIENKDKVGLIIWKYFDKFLKNQTVTYIVLDQNKKVIGHYSNIPLSVSYTNKSYKSLVCTDMCTDLAHRGKGLISKLAAKVYLEVKNKNYDFSLGFSNDAGVKVDRYSKNYGYCIVGNFVRYFKFVIYRKNIKYKLISTNKFASDFYSPNSKYLKIKKDRNYLNWRYFKKPNSEYEVYTIAENDIIHGYVILRFINYKCYIYDIVTKNEDRNHMITVLRSIENKALDNKIRLIIYNVLDNNYWKSLFNRYKYFKKVRNNINYCLTIKIHSQSIKKNFVLNKENWILMNGDIL